MRKLTKAQAEALDFLDRQDRRYPLARFGYIPGAVFSGRACLQMEARGLVKVERIQHNHFRYSITPAGRALLASEVENGEQG